MTSSATSKAIQHLRRAVLVRDGAGLTDGQLLDRFIERRDETAFAALVKRHGALVWGVCRRLLSHHDAEDAFQATFLVLCRKAASVRPRHMLANWLYGVAHRTALHAKRTAGRRRAKERQVAEMPQPAVPEPELWKDLQPVLDQELSRLPDSYRVVLVLCDLEGNTRKGAARQLGCPEGTVAGRLARARALLAKRLARRGVVLSGGALAAVLSQRVALASVPTSVVSATIKAAGLCAAGPAAAGVVPANVAALTEGVLQTMLLAKLKAAIAVLLMAGVVCLGAQFLLRHTAAAGQGQAGTPGGGKAGEDSAPKDPSRSDREKLQGVWRMDDVQARGKATREVKDRKVTWTFDGDKLTTFDEGSSDPDNEWKATFKLDATRNPMEIDFDVHEGHSQGKTFVGIYALDGDNLKVCVGRSQDRRPRKFVTTNEDTFVIFRMKRQTPAGDGGKSDEKKPEAHYCRLVFGPAAKVQALVRLDGEQVAVDRDGDGKFDGKGEQFASEKDCKDIVLTDPDGKTSYVITSVHALHVVPPEKFLEVRVHIRGALSYPEGCIVQMAARPEDAPKVHFHGPLTVAPQGWRIANRASRLVENDLADLGSLLPPALKRLAGKELAIESALPRSLKRTGEPTMLSAGVVTEGVNNLVAVCSPDDTDEGRREKSPFPEGVHPFVRVEFPGKAAGDPPVKKSYPLDQYAGDGFYRGQVRVPDEAGDGKAKVTFSFDTWKGARVAPTTVEIPVEEPPEEKKDQPR
jgi:RNA polymerase sigma factor (sigma-70 family)